MKTWIALIGLGGLLASPLGAAGVGFVRLLHAAGAGSGPLEFWLDGKPVRAGGYQLGNVTGGIALPPGTHQVAVRRTGAKDGETTVRVQPDETTMLIAFAERAATESDAPPAWQLRVLRLKQHEPEAGRTASFVSVSKQPELKVEMRQADGNWAGVFVKRLGVARAEIQQAKGYLSLRCGGAALTAISVAAAGNFVVVLFEDESGVLRSRNFQDYKYLSPD